MQDEGQTALRKKKKKEKNRQPERPKSDGNNGLDVDVGTNVHTEELVPCAELVDSGTEARCFVSSSKEPPKGPRCSTGPQKWQLANGKLLIRLRSTW